MAELAPGAVSDTALGDWYVNRIVVERQPLLLFVSAKSRLAMLEPARDLKNLTRRFPSFVEYRLRRLGIPDAEVEREVATMDELVLAPTRDRSILGQMNDFTHSTRCQFARLGRDRVDFVKRKKKTSGSRRACAAKRRTR